MSQLNLLIEKGNAIYGSQRALANELGKPETHVTMWKKKQRNCTPPDRAELAAAVGENPAVEALEAVLEGIDLEKDAGRKAAKAIKDALKRLTSL